MGLDEPRGVWGEKAFSSPKMAIIKGDSSVCTEISFHTVSLDQCNIN